MRATTIIGAVFFAATLSIAYSLQQKASAARVQATGSAA
jgi:hypothetical protein